MAQAKRIQDLKQDPSNRRKHSDRNVDMIADTMRSVGAARSIVIDEDDVIQAGNAAAKAAMKAGIKKLRIVDADGDELIAVRRRGLTAEQKRHLAIADNRTSELAEWDVDQLARDAADGLPMGEFWTPDELAKLLGVDKIGGAGTESVLEQAIQIQPAREYVVILCGTGEAGADEFERLRERLGLGMVRRGGYKHGSPFDAVGVQRVILASDVLAVLSDAGATIDEAGGG